MTKQSCQNPFLCKAKHKRWEKHQSVAIPLAEAQHEVFLEHLEKDSGRIDYHSHFQNKRSFERAISRRSIKEVIDYGWVIERNYFTDVQAYRIVILGYTSEKRSLHVVCEISSEREWMVITAYNPASMSWKWSSDYQKRVCFCKN